MRSTGESNPMGQWRQANTGLQRHPRIATSVPIRISTVDPEIDPNTGKAFFRSAEETTANLSCGGAYLRSWEPLEAGRRVIVAIDLPTGEELQLTGRVVWTRRELRPPGSRSFEAPGYGVEFSDNSKQDLDRLDRFLGGLDPAASRRVTGTATASPTTRPSQPSQPASRLKSASISTAPSPHPARNRSTSPETPAIRR